MSRKEEARLVRERNARGYKFLRERPDLVGVDAFNKKIVDEIQAERRNEMLLTAAQNRTVQIQILRIMRRFAPSSTALRILNVGFLGMRRRWKGNPARCTRAVVGMLTDGLSYGNWPWVSMSAVMVADIEQEGKHAK